MIDRDRPELHENPADPPGTAAFGLSGGVTPAGAPPGRPEEAPGSAAWPAGTEATVHTERPGRAEFPAPALYIHLDRIRHNAVTLVRLCAERGVRVMGVTKGACGEPRVAAAMLDGGVRELGDSRLPNLRRLRAAGINAPLWLLRLPQISQARETVELADGSLNSEPVTLRALSDEAVRSGRTHRVILMADLGDRREGLMPGDLVAAAREAFRLPGLKLEGIGTNLTCFGGVCPTPENLGLLADLARQVERATGSSLRTVSGGNSSSLLLLQERGLPPGVNHLRLGESILLGVEAIERQPVPGARPDAFVLEAEAIEVKRKPSLPEGEIAVDAFGNVPVFTDLGVRRRAILAVGRQDVLPEALGPELPGALVLGASSDHLILDVEEVESRVGDRFRFLLGYGALLAAMTSPYIRKVYLS